MSIYVRELLFDLDRLDIITKCDIIHGIEHLYKTSQIDYGQVYVLNKYFEGYTLPEICSHLGLDEAKAIEEDLVATLALLENHIRYTDEEIIQHGVRIYPKYRKTIEAFRNKCARLSKEL